MKKPKPESGRKKSDPLASLNIRKRKYVAGRMAGKSKKESALEADYSESMARNAAAKIEDQDVRSTLQELARKAVPAAKIVKRLQEGLDATWVHQDGKRGTTAEPYYKERREYLILAAKLGGYYTEKQRVDAEVKVEMEDAAEMRERILARIQELANDEVEKRMQAMRATPPPTRN
jgi:hypothetical protein